MFGLTALGIQQSNTWIATVPLSGSVIVDGQVVDQIKSDTYLFLMSGQQYVLQTTIFLGP
ncbi:MAG: hypothetical protein Q8O99_06625 [bacterium]|nr:hypothetical protein [bacterium]